MKRKLILVGLILMLLTGAILFGSLVYMTNMVLPKGSAEEFVQLANDPNQQLFRGEDVPATSAKVVWRNLKEYVVQEYAQQLGGVFVYEEEKYVLLYMKDASEPLRQQLQTISEETFQNGPREIALRDCDYSLRELALAQQVLDSYLETAPLSVKRSVQTAFLAPRQNRIAVYVRQWSVFDQLNLARAMGTLSPRLFIVKEDLSKTTPDISVIEQDEWLEKLQEVIESGSKDDAEADLVPNYEGAKLEGPYHEHRLTFYENYHIAYPEGHWSKSILQSIGHVSPVLKRFSPALNGAQISVGSAQRMLHMVGGVTEYYEAWKPEYEAFLRAVYHMVQPQGKLIIIRLGDVYDDLPH